MSAMKIGLKNKLDGCGLRSICRSLLSKCSFSRLSGVQRSTSSKELRQLSLVADARPAMERSPFRRMNKSARYKKWKRSLSVAAALNRENEHLLNSDLQ